MRISVPHHTTREEARQIIEKRLDELHAQHGHYASEVEKNWNGDALEVKVKARGFSGTGKVEITDSEVIIDGKLPLMARPFEPRIKSMIESEAAELFGRG